MPGRGRHLGLDLCLLDISPVPLLPPPITMQGSSGVAAAGSHPGLFRATSIICPLRRATQARGSPTSPDHDARETLALIWDHEPRFHSGRVSWTTYRDDSDCCWIYQWLPASCADPADPGHDRLASLACQLLCGRLVWSLWRHCPTPSNRLPLGTGNAAPIGSYALHAIAVVTATVLPPSGSSIPHRSL